MFQRNLLPPSRCRQYVSQNRLYVHIYQITSFHIAEYASVLEGRNVEDGGVPTLYQTLLPKKDRVERFHLFFLLQHLKRRL